MRISRISKISKLKCLRHFLKLDRNVKLFMKAKTQAKLFSVECGPRRRDGGGDSRRGGGDRPSRTPMPGDDTEEYEEEAKRLDR